MKLWELLAVPAGVCRQPSLVLRPHRYVFIMSHMRSRSTLLCHILGSHPEITGHLENHQSYRGRHDLLRLKAKLRWTTGEVNSSGYALDKVLHNRRVIAANVAKRADVTLLFLLRKPAQAIPSILRNQLRTRPDFTLEQAVSYYVQRLACLQRYTPYPARRIFIESDQLIEETVEVLQFIAEQLQLSARLSENYQRFRYTGRDGWGDASAAIHAGVVQRQSPEADLPAVDLPPALLSQAETAYQQCARHCRLTCHSFGLLPAKVSAA